ncbi:hypothetical protein [Paucihalobacter sp.]|uniref:hypothetical protein n=1 Tax=Paucihalobacter sp. TaxID=2850405 RepID=UPI002FE3A360
MIYSQNVPPNESQKVRMEQKMEERKQDYINNFLYTLEVDEFQKEIIRQKLNSFFDEKINILKRPYKRSIEFQEAITSLENSHFKDIEEMVTKTTMTKIIEMAQGDFNEKDVLREKRKNKKKN